MKILDFFSKIYIELNIYFEFFILKFIWNKINSILLLIEENKNKKKSFMNIFIKDKEDENLNEKFLKSIDNNIKKLNTKYYYWLNKLNIFIFKYEILEKGFYEKLILNCAKSNIKPEKFNFIKDIIIFYIKTEENNNINKNI